MLEFMIDVLVDTYYTTKGAAQEVATAYSSAVHEVERNKSYNIEYSENIDLTKRAVVIITAKHEALVDNSGYALEELHSTLDTTDESGLAISSRYGEFERALEGYDLDKSEKKIKVIKAQVAESAENLRVIKEHRVPKLISSYKSERDEHIQNDLNAHSTLAATVSTAGVVGAALIAPLTVTTAVIGGVAYQAYDITANPEGYKELVGGLVSGAVGSYYTVIGWM